MNLRNELMERFMNILYLNIDEIWLERVNAFFLSFSFPKNVEKV